MWKWLVTYCIFISICSYPSVCSEDTRFKQQRKKHGFWLFESPIAELFREANGLEQESGSPPSSNALKNTNCNSFSLLLLISNSRNHRFLLYCKFPSQNCAKHTKLSPGQPELKSPEMLQASSSQPVTEMPPMQWETLWRLSFPEEKCRWNESFQGAAALEFIPADSLKLRGISLPTEDGGIVLKREKFLVLCNSCKLLLWFWELSNMECACVRWAAGLWWSGPLSHTRFWVKSSFFIVLEHTSTALMLHSRLDLKKSDRLWLQHTAEAAHQVTSQWISIWT